MASQPQVVPGLGVRGQERRCHPELFNCLGVLAPLDEPLTLQQRPRARGGAACEYGREDQEAGKLQAPTSRLQRPSSIPRGGTTTKLQNRRAGGLKFGGLVLL